MTLEADMDVDFMIAFEYMSGGFAVNARMMVELMPLSHYRQWVKLFNIYGEKSDKFYLTEYIDGNYIEKERKEIEPLQAEIDELTKKAAGETPGFLSPDYYQREIAKRQRKLNGHLRKIKRYETMKGLIK